MRQLLFNQEATTLRAPDIKGCTAARWISGLRRVKTKEFFRGAFDSRGVIPALAALETTAFSQKTRLRLRFIAHGAGKATVRAASRKGKFEAIAEEVRSPRTFCAQHRGRGQLAGRAKRSEDLGSTFPNDVHRRIAYTYR
jgi:hypothetical protein